VLRDAVFSPLNLGPAPRGLACSPALLGDVLLVQTQQLVLATPDQTPPDCRGMAAACTVDPPTSRAIPNQARKHAGGDSASDKRVGSISRRLRRGVHRRSTCPQVDQSAMIEESWSTWGQVDLRTSLSVRRQARSIKCVGQQLRQLAGAK